MSRHSHFTNTGISISDICASALQVLFYPWPCPSPTISIYTPTLPVRLGAMSLFRRLPPESLLRKKLMKFRVPRLNAAAAPAQLAVEEKDNEKQECDNGFSVPVSEEEGMNFIVRWHMAVESARERASREMVAALAYASEG